MAQDTLLGFPAHTLPYRFGGFTTLLTVSGRSHIGFCLSICAQFVSRFFRYPAIMAATCARLACAAGSMCSLLTPLNSLRRAKSYGHRLPLRSFAHFLHNRIIHRTSVCDTNTFFVSDEIL